MSFDYSWNTARKDLVAGLTVAALSLPQAMAYALIAGVDPRFGLYSAIVVTAVAAVFGSSNHLINGPSNAISLVVFSALAIFDPDNRLDLFQAMFLLAAMVGIIQILIAVFRLGDLTRYISESVVIGFMAGASALIAIGQVANFFGLHDKGNGRQQVLVRLWNTLTGGGPVNVRALAVGASTVALVLALKSLVRRYGLPRIEMLASLVAVTAAATLLGWTVPTAGGGSLVAVVGSVPASLPAPHIPDIHWSWIPDLTSDAFAIALLGLLEALAIAKAIAHETRQRLDYNRQILAEGLANLTGGFFQCLPGSGSLTRSAINHQAGAVTRFSGLFTAAAVAITVLVAAPLARFIPKASLAGLLFVIAVRLIDWKRVGYILRASRYDAALALVTALAAVFVSVESSILLGVGLSIALFIPRAARLRKTELIISPEGLVREAVAGDPPAKDLLIYDLEGELFFGVAPELDRAFEEILSRARTGSIRTIVLRVKRTRNPDVVFLERLEHFLRESGGEGVTVLLAGVRPDFARGLANLRFGAWFPDDRVFLEEDKEFSATLKAVRRAYALAAERPSGSGEAPRSAPPREPAYYLV